MLTEILCLLAFASSSYANNRIVNGSDAEEGEFPYAVSLRRMNDHTCGGTILNEKYVLTAAHCVCKDAEPQNSTLFSIQYDLLTITYKPINVVPVKQIYCHKYNSEKKIFDSAVLELKKPIPKGKWKPVKIVKYFETKKKQRGTIIGWGSLHHGGPSSKTLQKLNVDIYNDKVCGERHDIKHHICFGGTGGACHGDSGTALIVNGVQVGIASFMRSQCGNATEIHPNVYSRISTYYDWIQKIAQI